MGAMIRSDESASCHEKGCGAVRRRGGPCKTSWRARSTALGGGDGKPLQCSRLENPGEGQGGPQSQGSQESDTPERLNHHHCQGQNAESR